jgi:hypothetical protein
MGEGKDHPLRPILLSKMRRREIEKPIPSDLLYATRKPFISAKSEVM